MKRHIAQYYFRNMCFALQVSRSGYYRWLKFGERVNRIDNDVNQCFHAHKARAGVVVIYQDLKAQGLAVSERSVCRSMLRQGLRAKSMKKYRPASTGQPRDCVHDNQLNRQFAVAKPNQVWVGDITYLRTTEGWLYLSVLIDLFGRKVVAWQMGDRIDQHLVNDTLKMAYLLRGKPSGVMIHTDQGSQYGAYSFQNLVASYGFTQSMSRKGNCWDNAVAESFFASLKKQAIHGVPVPSKQHMRQIVFEYIEVYYHRIRRHAANQWRTPVEFENIYQQA
jgi:putative transposase